MFLTEYKRIMQVFVNRQWEEESLLKFANSECESWLSARAKQCAAKQASVIVRAVRRKYDSRAYVIQKMVKKGDLVGAERLQKIQDACKISIPEIKNASAELDSRFFKIIEGQNHFDLWVVLSSMGYNRKISLPLCKTKVFHKWSFGKLKNGIRLGEDRITLFFESESPPRKGKVIGIDVGMKKAFSVSDGFQSKPDNHNHTLASICATMNRKRKGSKAYARTQKHRRNHIRWSVNQLNLSNVSEVRLENIKNLRKGRATSALLSRWNYADMFVALNLKCEELGVRVIRVQNAYTSRRCHACGWTEKRNRKGETFKCQSCNYTANADINAAQNISLNLSIERRPNLDQFYWSKRELTVPVTETA